MQSFTKGCRFAAEASSIIRIRMRQMPQGKGVARDNNEAYFPYSLALATGLEVVERLAAVAGTLTPKQIEDTDLLVGNSKPSQQSG
jgi:hypothetical protein